MIIYPKILFRSGKGYMKAVKAKLAETKPERVEAFEKGAAAYAKKIVANFKDYEFVSQENIPSAFRRDSLPDSNVVYRGVDESGWHGLAAQLPRGWNYTCVDYWILDIGISLKSFL